MTLQRINDERLIIKNLKNLRLVFIIQTIGIVGLLGYGLITEGRNNLVENPLWLVLIVSTVVLSFSSLKTDERLAFKNLQIIRIAYVIQLLGIVGILGYDFVAKGINQMHDNPLWFVFIISVIILVLLSMNISVDHENSINKSTAKTWLLIALGVIVLIAVTVGIATSVVEESIVDGLLTGGILFICGLAPFLFLYMLRRKSSDY